MAASLPAGGGGAIAPPPAALAAFATPHVYTRYNFMGVDNTLDYPAVPAACQGVMASVVHDRRNASAKFSEQQPAPALQLGLVICLKRLGDSSATEEQTLIFTSKVGPVLELLRLVRIIDESNELKTLDCAFRSPDDETGRVRYVSAQLARPAASGYAMRGRDVDCPPRAVMPAAPADREREAYDSLQEFERELSQATMHDAALQPTYNLARL